MDSGVNSSVHDKVFGILPIIFGRYYNAKSKKEFKDKHFTWEVILWAVRWYCQFAISYRYFVIMAGKRGSTISHTTIMRWVHEYAPKLAKKLKPYLKRSNDGYESMHMLRKGQVKRLAPEDVRANVKFIENLFGVAA